MERCGRWGGVYKEVVTVLDDGSRLRGKLST